MNLSAPVYILKQHAKTLSRREHIPLHEALDRIARQEGYEAWSLLAAKVASEAPASRLLERLRPGDLVLLAARPGQGKTLLSLELAIEAVRQGNRAAFFTLDFTLADVADRLQAMGEDLGRLDGRFHVDDSDEISADYIVGALATAPAGTLVIVDYLQLLDQNREKPGLMEQVRRLRTFAQERGLIVLCLSQIDRRYDAARQEFPGARDVRLPNPLDLTIFDKTCFLSRGRMQLDAGAPR